MSGPWEKYKGTAAAAPASGPWLRYQAPAGPRTSIAEDVASGAADVFESTIASAEDMVPGIGIIDKIGAANYAAQQEIGDLFRDEKDQKDWTERYETEVKNAASRRQASKDKSVAGEVIGTVAGIVPSLALPMPGAGAKGIGGVLSRIGGAAGVSAVDQGTRTPDKVFDSGRAFEAGTTAGEIGTGIEVGAGLVRGLAPAATAARKGTEKAAEWLDEVADARAFKAAAGNQGRIYDRTPRDKRLAIGRQLRDEGVVGFGSSARGIEERAGRKVDEAWEGMSAAFKEVDEAVPEGAVYGKDIADGILEYAARIDSPGNKARVNDLLEQAQDFQNKGKLSMERVQELKNTYKWDDRDPSKIPVGKEAANAIKLAIADAQERALERYGLAAKGVSEAVEAVPQSQFGQALKTGSGRTVTAAVPEGAVLRQAELAADGAPDPAQALERYQHAKKQYGSFKTAEEAAEGLANRHEKNHTFSLSDHLIALAQLLRGDEETWKKTAKATAAAVGNKALRERGSASLSAAAGGLAELLKRSPEAFGQFARPLEQASRRGNTALITTHIMLLEKDPRYRALFEGE